MTEKEKQTEKKIDNDLYSRSIFTYGLETMQKLSQMKILIMGMRGLGIETAKNIILSGPDEVDIFDPNLVKINDLGSNFFLSEEDVGKKNRDEACLEKLSKLNQYVKISILKIEQKNKNDLTELTKLLSEKIDKYNVVVITEFQSMYFLDQIDKICRYKNIKIIYGICLGLVGYIFTDFGPQHLISDENGKEIKTFLIKSITKDKEGLVTIDNIEGTNDLNIGTGDFVKFKNVGGMEELNDEKREFQIIFENLQSFKIGDTSNFGEYTKGGEVYQVKKPIFKQYFEFIQRAFMISDPYHPLINTDFTKAGRNELLYMTFTGVHDYYLSHNFTLPELNNMEQAKIILENTRKFYETSKQNKNPCYDKVQEFNEKIVLNVARWASANIQPICAFFGGIIAQEIIKATGKYVPIDQWLICDFFEIVENISDNVNRTLKNCRYDDQIAIFGNEIQEKIQKSNIFQVGAGATGCEFLKNFAMMGFCTDKNSKFVVTDNDNIEISNLNRQFLFRKNNVGQSKSITAVKSVQEMNPSFNAEGMQTKVCKETEELFNEDFWEKQNFIIFAVDSIEARKYINDKVLSYQKPAVDSGTEGIIAKSQIIIPHKTKNYLDKAPTRAPKSIPVCTLSNFPSLIKHCIEWSRDSFHGYFGNIIKEIKEFFVNYDKFKEIIKKEGSPKSQLDKLEIMKIHIDIIVNKDINKMCEYAVKIYTENFDHKIRQLLNTYPPDCKASNGKDFWSGSRKLPHPIQFDPNNELCLNYIIKFIQILSHSLGIKLSQEQLSSENIKKICSSIKIPEFVHKDVKIDLGEEEKNDKQKQQNNSINDNEKEKNQKEQQEAQKKVDEIMKELDELKKQQFDAENINPEKFEKDHDENGHIDFIHYGANLRARNYNIDQCDRNKTKQIAGNIIPTVLTTTATVAGIVSLQLYTMFQTNENKFFRECLIDLSINNYCFFPPQPPIKMKDKEPENEQDTPEKAIPEGWNAWDRIEIKGPKTCGEICDFLKKQYNIDVEMLIAGNGIPIYNIDSSSKKNIDLKVEDAYEKKTKKKIDEKIKYILLAIFGSVPEAKIGDKTYKNVTANIPPIKYIFK